MMDDLIKRLEAAARPSRELDADIVLALYPNAIIEFDPAWQESATVYHAEPLVRNKGELPSFTSSIDAALTLVPEKSMWSVCIMEEGPFAQVLRAMPSGGYVGGYIGSYANTPAIALVIAALKARL